MPWMLRTLVVATALTTSMLPAVSQDASNESPDAQHTERDDTATPGDSGEAKTPGSDISTFDPTAFERRLFADDGFFFSDGEDVYASVCSGCHMPKGEGAEGAGHYPALANNPNLQYPEYAINLILVGQKGMPSFGDMLDDEQVANVVNYIRSNLGNDFVSGEAGEATAQTVEAMRPQGPADQSGQAEHE